MIRVASTIAGALAGALVTTLSLLLAGFLFVPWLLQTAAPGPRATEAYAWGGWLWFAIGLGVPAGALVGGWIGRRAAPEAAKDGARPSLAPPEMLLTLASWILIGVLAVALGPLAWTGLRCWTDGRPDALDVFGGIVFGMLFGAPSGFVVGWLCLIVRCGQDAKAHARSALHGPPQAPANGP